MNSADFGRRADAAFKSWDAASHEARGLVARAYVQHQLVCDIAAYLRVERMTQAELAASIGVRPGTLSKQLTGSNWMPAEDIYAIISALEHVDWLPTPSDFSELLPGLPEAPRSVDSA